jgi:hypothetical protein
MINEIEIGMPYPSIKLNLPKDLDRPINKDNWEKSYDIYDNIVKELIKLNPQIPSNIMDNGGTIDDVAHWIDEEIPGPTASLKVFLNSYFYWLGRNLWHYYNGFNIDYTEEQHEDANKFAEEAIKGRWIMIPKITDFKNYDPYIEDLNEIEVGIPDNNLSNDSRSSLVKPAVFVFVFGFFKSISSCATFRSPQTITTFFF